MKFPCITTALLAAAAFPSDAFVPKQSAFRRVSILKSQHKFNEFEYLLQETSDSQVQQTGHSRRRIMLNNERATVLASTTFAAPGEQEYVDEADPYADIGLEQANPQVLKLQEENQSFSQRFENKLKTMDFQDIVSTLIIPSIIAFAGIRWGYNRVSERVTDKADDLLDAFASEMIYHDGDFEEMKMCHSDYTKKLLWLGPTRTQTMLKKYLELYAKKRTVSPQAISSLSYVFSLFKLSEEKAAQILVSLCRDMGDGKVASAGKLLFFGSRILKSPEGKAALVPIKEMIKATYREAKVAETMVDTSQQAMAEAAYRTAVISAGKHQESLTVGWEVLGLDKETATRVFEAEAKEGFMTDREKMYGGQSTKYDSKGNILDKKGKIADPEAAKAAEEEKEEEASSNVYECSECGYTLFIAKGREFKFYGDDFKCPECGAGKDKFQGRDIEAE
mmetsp:Transcript_118814/g.177593  ORF Transcript_118814/g.177593 Transcript_118814/m.177593 type:complete len:449 (+) Transcript_118814:129-1475(+)